MASRACASDSSSVIRDAGSLGTSGEITGDEAVDCQVWHALIEDVGAVGKSEFQQTSEQGWGQPENWGRGRGWEMMNKAQKIPGGRAHSGLWGRTRGARAKPGREDAMVGPQGLGQGTLRS